MPRCCSRIALLLAPLVLVALTATSTRAGEVFAKPPTPGGGVNNTSWVPEDGSDSDTYSWDEFTLAETQTITEVRWRGGYALGAPYGHAFDFRVSFFDSAANGFQPVLTAFPSHESQETVIATFHTNNAADESFAGVSGGVVMYDYRYTLPTPVTLQGGVKYWFRVVASQPIYPDWGMATGTGGNGSHFRYSTGTTMYQNWPHDLAFSLHAAWVDGGPGVAGVAGVPLLEGTGTLAGGSNSSMVLTSAKPSSTAWLVLGLTAVNLPFKGGTLVPEPLLMAALATNAAGSVTLTFGMPVGVPPGADIISQYWIPDSAAMFGFAASNGLTGTTP